MLCCAYRKRRAACPWAYPWAHPWAPQLSEPAPGVPCVPRTVAPQAPACGLSRGFARVPYAASSSQGEQTLALVVTLTLTLTLTFNPNLTKITWRAVTANEAAAGAAGAPPPRDALPASHPRRRMTAAWLAPLGWLVPGGGRASSAALVTLAWLAGRWWPSLVTTPLLEACAALPPLPLVPWLLPPLLATPALLPPLLAALLVVACAAVRAVGAWRTRANATWSFFLAPVPEAADQP